MGKLHSGSKERGPDAPSSGTNAQALQPISFYVTAPPDNYSSWIGFNDEDKDKESPAYKARHCQDKVQWELMDLVAEHNDRWCSFNIDTVHEAVHESVDYTFLVSEDDKRVDPPPFHRLECATIDMSHYGAPTIYETIMKYAPIYQLSL
ncbi:hypothetical protein AAF712_016527 [Marasmius tenuissimus]|uniref:Uncharacterized protein n=1 Tax=Marasmius tenuissimus TaxID=585030 RepID=A0ABR2Z788_9AGAR